jgi:16S rRNA (guanine(966)-N(2))-methyltransferase RsmD
MRIISGTYGGRRINPPSNMPYTRPTTDLAKEGLFNVLQNNLDFNDIRTLDLFGGTGSITYELASRGVKDCTIVEKDIAMFVFIKKTLTSLGIENCNVVRLDVFRFMEQCTESFDFIFAGPPYALETINRLPEIVFERNLLKPDGWFVLEHTPRNDYTNFPFFKTARKYGTTIFSVFINNIPE